jgi:uncharacterized membrane protein YedE/YeeE
MSPTEFTPLAGAVGGALIGASAVLLLATAGRIAGASFIFGGLFTSRIDENFSWKALFIVGLLIGAAIAGLFWFDPATIHFPAGPLLTAISGLIVGIGVTLGNGCTSGHGICGLSRFSLRSLVATGVFMTAAIITVFVTRHVVGV